MKYRVTQQIEVEANDALSAVTKVRAGHNTAEGKVYDVQKQRSDGVWDHKKPVKLGMEGGGE